MKMARNNDKKIVFMGTPDFAVNSLERLISSGYDIIAVYTQPDRPRGRGYKLSPSPVKACALSYDLRVLQPENFKSEDVLEQFSELKPDIVIVVAYGIILPEAVLDLPRYGCVNIHGSILSQYRGAAPIQHAILNGESETGVSLMQMDRGMDTGDIIDIVKTDISRDETCGELFGRLSVMGAQLLIDTLPQIFDGSAVKTKQNDAKSSYAPQIKKSDTFIDFNKSKVNIINLVRALAPVPGACFKLDEKLIKVYAAEATDQKGAQPGIILCADRNDGFVISCSDGAVRLLDIKPEGTKRMSAAQFLSGNVVNVGTCVHAGRE